MSNDDTVNRNELEKRKFVDEKEGRRSNRKKRPKHQTDTSRTTRTMRGKTKSTSSDEECTSSSDDGNSSSGDEETEADATMDLVESDKRGGRGEKGSHTFSRRSFWMLLLTEKGGMT